MGAGARGMCRMRTGEVRASTTGPEGNVLCGIMLQHASGRRWGGNPMFQKLQRWQNQNQPQRNACPDTLQRRTPQNPFISGHAASPPPHISGFVHFIGIHDGQRAHRLITHMKPIMCWDVFQQTEGQRKQGANNCSAAACRGMLQPLVLGCGSLSSGGLHTKMSESLHEYGDHRGRPTAGGTGRGQGSPECRATSAPPGAPATHPKLAAPKATTSDRVVERWPRSSPSVALGGARGDPQGHQVTPAPPLTRSAPAPLCDIPSGCCSFTGLWTVTRSSLRMLRRVAGFCRPLWPVLLLVSFARQWRPMIGVLRMCWLLPGSFDCFCCPHTSVHRPSIACLAVFPCSPGALFLHALSGPSTICPFPPHGWSAPDGLPLLLRKQPPRGLSSPALGARWIHKALSSGCEWVGWFEREASVVLPFHGTTPGVSQCSDAQMQRPHNAQMDTSERCVSGASGHHNTTHLHKVLAHSTPRVSTSGCKKYGQAHYRSWQQ